MKMLDNVIKYGLVVFSVFTFLMLLNGLGYVDAYCESFGFHSWELDLRNIDLIYHAIQNSLVNAIVWGCLLIIVIISFYGSVVYGIAKLSKHPRWGRHVEALKQDKILPPLLIFIALIFLYFGAIGMLRGMIYQGHKDANDIMKSPSIEVMYAKFIDHSDKEIFFRLTGELVATSSRGDYVYTTKINGTVLDEPVTTFIPTSGSARFIPIPKAKITQVKGTPQKQVAAS